MECLGAITGVYVKRVSDSDYIFANETMWGYEGRDGPDGSLHVMLMVDNLRITREEADGYQVRSAHIFMGEGGGRKAGGYQVRLVHTFMAGTDGFHVKVACVLARAGRMGIGQRGSA
eukprot:359186-Chlamydomonas_euryale.AAC.5